MPKSFVNKKLNHFFGDSIVLGCGHCLKNLLADFLDNCHHYLHSNHSYFYSIDESASAHPDYLVSIESLPKSMLGKFNFVFLEYLPFDVYLKSENGINYNNHYADNLVFQNQNIEGLLGDEGAILIMGFLPRKNDPKEKKLSRFDGIIYYGRRYVSNLTFSKQSSTIFYPCKRMTNEVTLLLKNPLNIDPNLLMMSLNPDAQRLVDITTIKIPKAIAEYNFKLNNNFIKMKSIELLDKQIAQLIFERNKVPSWLNFGRKHLKDNKINALINIRNCIFKLTDDYSPTAITDIINTHLQQYPDIKRGFFQHRTSDIFRMIKSLERYHESHFFMASNDQRERLIGALKQVSAMIHHHKFIHQIQDHYFAIDILKIIENILTKAKPSINQLECALEQIQFAISFKTRATLKNCTGLFLSVEKQRTKSKLFETIFDLIQDIPISSAPIEEMKTFQKKCG